MVLRYPLRVFGSILLLQAGLCQQAQAQAVSGNHFLQGNHIEVGVAPNGAFGSTVNAPSGYHPRNDAGTLLGFVADVAKDGWSTGSPAFHGDFFLPGSPQEGWSIATGTTQADAWRIYGGTPTGALTGTNVSYNTSATEVSSLWQGTFNTNLQVKQLTVVKKDKLYFTVKVTLKNTGSSTVPNVYYTRTVDPDNDVTITGSFTTQNKIEYVLPNPGNKVLVRAIDTYHPAAYLGLGTMDCRARPYIMKSGLTPSHNIKTLYDAPPASNYYTTAGATSTNDVGIGIVYSLGNIAPGDSTTFTYAYILNQADMEEALQQTAPTWTAGGISKSKNDTLILPTCTFPASLPIAIANGSNYTWTWAATGATLSSLPDGNTMATVTGPATISAIGIGACGNDSFRLVVLPAPGATPPVVVSPVTYCQDAPAGALSATGTSLLWYTSPSGGTGSTIAPTPATGTAGTTTWYVSQTISGCESPRVPINVVVNPAKTNTVTATTCSGGSYLYNGVTYTTTGSYLHHFTTSKGCDSAVTLNLTITPPITNTVTASICNGSSYTFGGSALGTAGTYTHSFTAAGGCDSVVTLHLTVNPVYNTVLNDTICQGSAYTWAGSTYATAGSYPHTFTSMAGCDSTVTLHLSVNPAYHTSFSATICSGNSYAFAGTAYSTSGSYAHTFTTAKGCDSVVTLNLTVTPAITYSFNAETCAGSSYTWAGTAYTSAGSYTKSFVTASGCDSIATLNLTVNPTYNTSISAEICQGTAYTWAGSTYTATGAYPHTFTTAKGCDSVVTLHLTVNPTYNTAYSAAICAGSSYSFGGNSYTATGAYAHTFTTVKGCDSTVTLNLTVNPIVNTSFSAAICQGGSYSFGGSSYNTAGAYPHTFTAVTGCDSVVTLNLTVNPTYNTSFTAAICAGGSYSFGGTSYTATGVYPHTFTTAKGCDSTVTLNLTVHPIYTTSFSASICAGNSYPFGGSSYSTSGTYTHTFATVKACDSTVTLHLTVNPVYNTAFDAAICEGSSYAWAGNNYSTSGSYTRTFTSVNGCDSTVTLNLLVNPTYNTAISAEICQGETYSWAGLGYTTTNSYTRTFTTVKGCDSIVTLNLTVHPSYNLNTSATICQGSSYAFGGSTYTTAGVYPHTFSTVKGCDSTVTLTLMVNPTYNKSVSASICQGSSFTFGGNTYASTGAYPHTFTTLKGCDSIVTLNLTVRPVLSSVRKDTICEGHTFTLGTQSFTTPGTYQVPLVTATGCDSVVTVQLTVLSTPEMSFTLSGAGCVNEVQHIVLNATTTAQNQPYAWDFDGGQIVYGTGGGPYGIVWADSGWHTVTAINFNEGGCKSVTMRDSIYLYPLPEAKILSTPAKVCGLDTVALQAAWQQGNAYHWQPAAWVAGQEWDGTALVRVQRSGFIRLEVTNEGGCSASDSVLVQTENCCELELPTSFTPNGDGRNDVFRIPGKGHQILVTFRVVNRWGQTVFETTNPGHGWDGTLNGTPQAIGSYMYFLKYRCADGKLYEKQGDITLLR